MAARTSHRTLARTIAVTLALLLTTLLLPGTAFGLAAGASGGDDGLCGDDRWLRADWTEPSWAWSAGPEAPVEAQRSIPQLVIAARVDNVPSTVRWTSPDVPVKSVGVVTAAHNETFPGGRSGTVSEIDGLRAVVFCYDEAPTTTALTVTKTVEGRPASMVDTRVRIICGPPVADFRLAGGESKTVEIPDGTACGIEELETDGADAVTYTLDGVPAAPTKYGHVAFHLDLGQKATVEITNSYLPPEVAVEKAWFGAAEDDAPIAITRRANDGWAVVQNGPPGYVPPTSFELPADFDLTVTHGPDGYTVDETVPDGWQPMACPADAPDPNGLGTFSYLPPTDAGQTDNAQWPTRIVHAVCNARVPLEPGIDLVKTPDVDQVVYDPNDGDDETITYQYEVSNTGEVPLTGLTLIDDVLGPITLTSIALDVGESTTGTATHVVTPQDVTAGRVDNTAVVTGLTADKSEVTATATSSVDVSEVVPTVIPQPAIDLDKTALVTPDADGDQVVVWSSSAPDDTVITYRYTLSNSGETTVSDLRLVDDVLGEIPLAATELDVGETLTVTATHVVTAADAMAGAVTNTATATGLAPDAEQVSAAAEATVLVGEVLALADDQEQLPAAGARPGALALMAVLAMASGTWILRRNPRRM